AAWGRIAYREQDNSFIPMLTDGYSLEGFVIRKEGYFGPKGRIENPLPASLDFLWMYAYGYRISGDPFLWQVAKKIAGSNGLGDIGEPDGQGVNLNEGARCTDYRGVYSLLELYRASGNVKYLMLAKQVGINLVREY